jgi:hypothetical protein
MLYVEYNAVLIAKDSRFLKICFWIDTQSLFEFFPIEISFEASVMVINFIFFSQIPCVFSGFMQVFQPRQVDWRY